MSSLIPYIQGFLKAAKEYAPGIPDKETFKSLPNLTTQKDWEFAVHEHDAKKRGLHYDLRLGDPETGHAHSWAMEPKWPKPGEKTWAIAQPTHTVKYMDFEGNIPEGYGAGNVSLFKRSKTEIINSSPNHISFNLYTGKGPEEYTLHKIGGKNWILYNRTLKREDIKGLPSDKPIYKEQKNIDFTNEEQLMSAKIDDAHNLFAFPAGKQIRVLSYRPSERESGVIEHTHKIPGLLGLKTPNELAGTIIRGGIYAQRKNEKTPLESHILSGLLNSNVWKSRKDQETLGSLKPVIYDVVTFKGKDISTASYKEKLDILKNIQNKLPIFKLPDMALDAVAKQTLWNKINNKEHEDTHEGVVLWNLKESLPPIKVKIKSEHDVYLREPFEGEGKYKEKGVGGFKYSFSPDGEIVGHVGTGLSDELRKDMFTNFDKYKGMVAKLHAMEKFPSGALRAPSFLGWHLDKNSQDKLERVISK